MTSESPYREHVPATPPDGLVVGDDYSRLCEWLSRSGFPSSWYVEAPGHIVIRVEGADYALLAGLDEEWSKRAPIATFLDWRAS